MARDGQVQRHVVAKAEDIAPGERLAVSVGNRDIAIFNVDGGYYALANRCPHEGGPLCGGLITGIPLSDGPNDYRISRKGEFIRCPWHGWEFDIKTETARKLGGPLVVGEETYIASIDLDPATGRYLYFVAGAHGGSYRDAVSVAANLAQ